MMTIYVTMKWKILIGKRIINKESLLLVNIGRLQPYTEHAIIEIVNYTL